MTPNVAGQTNSRQPGEAGSHIGEAVHDGYGCIIF
jgi:hypothetical protein